jgi:hypothetical protein
MKTFFYILYELIKAKNPQYPFEKFNMEKYSNFSYDREQEENSHILTMSYNIYLLFDKKIKSKNTQKSLDSKLLNSYFSVSKLLALSSILENSFYTNELKEKIINKYCLLQKYYFAFVKLAILYRIKKYKKVVDTDLSLNPLEQYNKNTFIIIQNKSKYLFSLRDLVNIIEEDITYSVNFYAECKWPKNPYNKQPLSESSIYNIYFKLKESTRPMSTLFHCFFKTNLNIKKFKCDYEALIRENVIKKYVYNTPYTELHKPIKNMLKNNKYTRLLKIDPEFQKKRFVEIFRPFFYYYCIINYDIVGTNKIYLYKSTLFNKLKGFYEYNKSFGRKYYKLIYDNKLTKGKKRVIKLETIINMDYIPFHKICVNTNDYYMDYTEEYYDDSSSSDEEINDNTSSNDEETNNNSDIEQDSVS